MAGPRLKFTFLAVGLAAATISACLPGRAQNPAETTPPEHKRTDPQQTTTPPQQPAPQPKPPTAAELSAKDTPGSAMLRTFEFE